MRAGNFAVVDGVLHVNVGVHGAFGFDVTHGCEAVAEGNLRVASGKNGAVRDGLLEELRVVVFLCDVALQQDMGVGIHESGQDGGF